MSFRAPASRAKPTALPDLALGPGLQPAPAAGLALILALGPVAVTDATEPEATDAAINGWRVERGTDPVSGTTGCLLTAGPFEMPDGYGIALVRLIFGPRGLLVTTDSNLDPEYPAQGLRVDDEALILPDSPFPFDRQHAQFLAAAPELIEQFRRGLEATLSLGFWPTWPMTETQHLQISLLGFSRAHNEFLACSAPRPTGAN